MRTSTVKNLVIICLMALVGVGLLISPSQSQNISSYHSGEVTQFNNSIYIGTTNTGNFELFSLEEGELYKKVDLVSPEGEDTPFGDLAFSQEDGNLYVYLVNGRFLYKYGLSDPTIPELVSKTKDNSWYWYNGIKKVGDKVATLGNKGVRIQKEDGTVITSYDIVNNISENVTFSPSGEFIFDLSDQGLEVFDTSSGEVISRIDYTNNSQEVHGREIYNDTVRSLIYLVDDAAAKAVDFNGNIVKKFDHISDQGYDLIPSADPRFVYFSDGVGVVKAKRDNLQPADWKFTTDVAADSGWAMDIERVGRGDNEKLIVFNHSSILVLDNNLKLEASVKAEKNNYSPIEPMSLSLDKNRAAPGSKILLSGGGFGLYEDLEIHFVNKDMEIEADGQGRFTRLIEVPSVLPKKTDITVEGQRTGKSYSIGFEIE